MANRKQARKGAILDAAIKGGTAIATGGASAAPMAAASATQAAAPQGSWTAPQVSYPGQAGTPTYYRQPSSYTGIA